MSELNVSLLDDIESTSYEIARQAVEYFNDWKCGRVYIPKPALRAMGRRYIALREMVDMKPLELFEFGRLFAFFAQMYPPDGEIPSTAGIAIDFSNLMIDRFNKAPSPTG